MTSTGTILRPKNDRPLRVFAGGDVELDVFPDRVEVDTRDAVTLLPYWGVRTCVPTEDGGRDALAIVDSLGQVLLVPMSPHDAREAADLIGTLLPRAA